MRPRAWREGFPEPAKRKRRLVAGPRGVSCEPVAPAEVRVRPLLLVEEDEDRWAVYAARGPGWVLLVRGLRSIAP